MSGNPKDSKWYATPKAARKRKPLAITLSDATRADLEWLASRAGCSKSEIIEKLVAGAGKGRLASFR